MTCKCGDECMSVKGDVFLFTSTKCVFEMACLYTLIGLKNCTYFDFSLIYSIAIVIEGGWKTLKCGNQSTKTSTESDCGSEKKAPYQCLVLSTDSRLCVEAI